MPAPTKPQDHLPAKSEAEGKDIDVEFHGETYTISREKADDVELFEHIEDEKYILAIRGFLGDVQWGRLKESLRNDEGRVTMTSFGEFLDAAMEAIGGNS